MTPRRRLVFALLFVLVPLSASAKDGTLCIVIDSDPPTLTEKTYESLRKGLCSGGAVEPMEKERADVRSLVLFALAKGDMRPLDTILDARNNARLLYSLHSSADGLIMHSVFVYDRASGATILGGRTFDQGTSVKNADERFAREAALAALTAVAARPTVQELAADTSSRLGAETAAILAHTAEATQFLVPRGPFTPEETAAVRARLSDSKTVLPGATRDLALCALAFLTGDDAAALAACDRYAKAGPAVSTAITQVNLRIALHRYEDALSLAEKTDKALGFDLFLLSRAWAESALGRTEIARDHFAAFVKRNGSAWEEAVLAIIKVARRAGEDRNTRALATLFLAAGPTQESRMIVESLSAP